jgi:hypothetical protein
MKLGEPPVEEAIAHLDRAIRKLKVQIRALRKQGILEGSIESYPKGDRIYYNYVYYQDGRPIRKYLPLKLKATVEAEIQRGREVARLEKGIALLQEVRQLLKS